MARPKKPRVDYFPHDCEHGPTIFILERKFGIFGYACWFKLQELLGRSNGHYYDCRKLGNWEFLQAHTHLEEDKLRDILNLLAQLEAIDPELWNHQVIWSENFVQGLAEVYRKRNMALPTRPNLVELQGQKGSFCDENPTSEGVSAEKTPVFSAETPQSKVKYIIPPLPPQTGGGESDQDFETWFSNYPPERQIDRLNAKRVWQRLKRQGLLRPLAEMLAVLAAQKASNEWLREEGRYVPLPQRYLSSGRFNAANPAREPPEVCKDCRGTGLRQARPGEESIGGKRVCECRDPNWQPAPPSQGARAP